MGEGNSARHKVRTKKEMKEVMIIRFVYIRTIGNIIILRQSVTLQLWGFGV